MSPKAAMIRILLMAALGSAACQKTSEKAPSATIEHPPPPQTQATSSSASLAAAVPEKVVCNAIDKSTYDLPPLDTRLVNTPLPPVVDDAHDLDPFYARLARLVRGKAKDHVRIAVYGDSNMTMDYITGAMRRLLQGKFGDGGHGYIAMARPWAWYLHQDVEQHINDSKWKKISTSTDHVGDGHYGFANVATETTTVGAYSSVGTVDDTHPIGKAVSNIDLFYLRRPQGGTFSVKVDGEKVLSIDASGAEAEATWEHFDMPDGAHKLEVVVDSGNVRLFGAALERTTPSIIVDSLGTGALNYEQMLHVSDASRSPMLKRRKYDLIVFLIGTNLFAPGLHERWMTQDIGWIEDAVPKTPILILSPPDIELHKEDTHSDPRIVALSKQLADIAKRHDWGFWDFRGAMGGDMSMMRFARSGLGAWDLVHLTHDGGALMGERFAHALFDGFDAYVKAHPDAGCEGE
jgi:lysophospholipase L1-like esterase